MPLLAKTAIWFKVISEHFDEERQNSSEKLKHSIHKCRKQEGVVKQASPRYIRLASNANMEKPALKNKKLAVALF